MLKFLLVSVRDRYPCSNKTKEVLLGEREETQKAGTCISTGQFDDRDDENKFPKSRSSDVIHSASQLSRYFIRLSSTTCRKREV